MYTPEITLDVVSSYEAATNEAERNAVIEEMAEKYDKSVASIRAKLVREEVYVKKESNSNGKRIKKADIVATIAGICNVEEELMDSLEKATVFALKSVLTTFVDMDKRIRELEAA